MFLPVLLIRDFGIWGFVVFAVPNVVGAAAMGWALTRGGAEAIRQHHVWAVRAFSVVTVSFQLFFFLAVNQWLAQFCRVWFVPQLALGLVAIAAARSRTITAAVLTLLGSLGIIAAFIILGDPHTLPLAPPALSRGHVVALAAVCLFGFLLCPYLDATFLRARSEAPHARASFGLGFGVFFFAMILFTLGYSGVFDDRSTLHITFALVAAHMVLQLGFTVGAHWGELWGNTARGTLSRWYLVVFTILASLVVLSSIAAGVIRGYLPLALWSDEEFIYRLFMSFYGLVFPAYTWVCVIPRRGLSIAAPSRASLIVCGLAIVLASPCYWLGFIERRTWWLVPGVAIVLVARLCVPRGERGGPDQRQGGGDAAPYTPA